MKKKILKILNKNSWFDNENGCRLISEDDFEKLITDLNALFELHIVSRSKPKEEKLILDSKKKCKGNKIINYYAIEKDVINDYKQTNEDKTLN